MSGFVLTICLLVCTGHTTFGQAEDSNPENDELVSIFNGTDLDGWEGDPRLWSVSDGAIRGETTNEKKTNGNTFLIWNQPVKDFELRFSFRCTAANNSGVQYRSRRVTEGERARNDWVVTGYQHEIRNENTFPDVPSFIYDEGGSRGRICLTGEKATWDIDGKKPEATLITEEEFQSLMKIDDWNDVRIVANGNHIQHYLNGRLVLDFIDKHPEKKLLDGVLALQLHAGNPMWAEFKDIRLRHID